MAQSTDKTLSNLIINRMPQSVYDAKKAAGELSDDELYLTPSRAEWITLCDQEYELVDGEEGIDAYTVSKLPDGTDWTNLGIKEIRFAGRLQVSNSTSYNYGTFSVNDKSIIIGQNFAVNNTSDSWFRGRFSLLSGNYAYAEWSNGWATGLNIMGGGITINPHQHGANQPDVAEGFTFDTINNVKISCHNQTTIKRLRLVVVGRK